MQWEMERVDNGWYIKNVKTGLYLSLEGQALDNTGVIGYSQPFLWHIWDDEEDSNTIRWVSHVGSHGGGAFTGVPCRICVPNTQQNLDLSDYGNPAPGTPINIWGRWSGQNQTWRIKRGTCTSSLAV